MKPFSLFLRIVLFCALLIAGLSNAPAASAQGVIVVRYAKPGGLTTGTCTTWATACDLPRAISQALAGEQVWAAAGTYIPGATRNSTFTLKSGVSIYGGFDGTESSLTARNWQKNVTILSGMITPTTKVYTVVTAVNPTTGAVLDGFTVTGGNANGSSGNPTDGAGIILNNSTVTLQNLIITGNTASNNGGGLNIDNGTVSIIDTVIANNTAGASAGGLNNVSANTTLTNVTFYGNTAPLNSGAGVRNRTNGTLQIRNSLLFGTDGLFISSGTVTVNNSDLTCPASATCTNSVNVDPHFVDPVNNNFRLNPITSTVIDKGLNTYVTGVSFDLAALTRVVDTVDMGAYENHKPEVVTPSTYQMHGNNVLNGQLVNELDGDPLTFTITTNVAHGTLVTNPNGSFTYTPTADYRGSDTFTFTASDGRYTTASTTVTITIINLAPTTSDQTFNGTEDQQIFSHVAATDTENDKLTFALVGNPPPGTFSLLPNGAFVFTAPLHSHGTYTFQFTVTDNVNPIVGPYTVTFNIAAVNYPPTSSDQSFNTHQNTLLNAQLAANDVDPEDTLTFALSGSAPAGQSFTLNPNGSFSYLPAVDNHGSVSFQFTVSDGTVQIGPYTATLNVFNLPPTSSNQFFTGTEDQQISNQLTAADAENNPLTFALVGSAPDGTFNLNADGSFTFTPPLHVTAVFTFQFSVSDGINPPSGPFTATLTVGHVNHAPTSSDQSFSTHENTLLNDQLVANDLDLTDTLTFTLSGSSPASQSFTLNPNGTFALLPVHNYHGPLSFKFTVSDGIAIAGPFTATVDVFNLPPTSSDKSFNGTEDQQLSGQLTGSDPESDVLTFALVGSAPAGTFNLQANGAFTYTAPQYFSGDKTFQFNVSDGVNPAVGPFTATLSLAHVNHAPVSSSQSYITQENTLLIGQLIATDVDSEDTLTFTLSGSAPASQSFTLNPDGSFNLLPNLGYHGPLTFQFIVSDGSVPIGPFTASINVYNLAPSSSDQSFDGVEDVQLSGQLTGTDPENDTLTFTLVGSAPAGTFNLNADGSFTFTTLKDANGIFTFEFNVSDGVNPVVGPHMATLNIAAVNDAPVSTPQSFGTPKNTPLSGQLTATDAEGDPITFTLDGSAPAGTFNLNPDGSFSFTPVTDFHGDVTFQFIVTDNHAAASAPYTATIAVARTNTTPPVLDPIPAKIVTSGSLLTFTATASDVDLPFGDHLTYELIGTPLAGASIDAQTGEFTWTAPLWIKGGINEYTVTIQVTDQDVTPHSVSQVVTITVRPHTMWLTNTGKY